MTAERILMALLGMQSGREPAAVSQWRMMSEAPPGDTETERALHAVIGPAYGGWRGALVIAWDMRWLLAVMLVVVAWWALS